MTGTPAAAGDSAPWLDSFRAKHPEITVSPPDASTVDWTAHRAGMVIARDFRPERLRDRLDYYLAQECGRRRPTRPVIGEPLDPRAWVRVEERRRRVRHQRGNRRPEQRPEGREGARGRRGLRWRHVHCRVGPAVSCGLAPVRRPGS